MKTAQELIASAKSRIKEVTSSELRNQRPAPVLIDVREQNEWNLGHIPGAMHIGRGVLETSIEARVSREAEIVLYCASGNRSALAASALGEMGYNNVSSLSGGIKGWVDSGGSIED